MLYWASLYTNLPSFARSQLGTDLPPRAVRRARDPRARPAPDLVGQDSSSDGPDRLWVADITYVASGLAGRTSP